MFRHGNDIKSRLINVAQWDESRRRENLMDLVAGLDDEDLVEAIGVLYSVADSEEDDPLFEIYEFGRMLLSYYESRYRGVARKWSNYDLRKEYAHSIRKKDFIADQENSPDPVRRGQYHAAVAAYEVLEMEMTRRLRRWLDHRGACLALPDVPKEVPKEEPAEATAD